MLPNERLPGRKAEYSCDGVVLTQTITADGGRGYAHSCDLATFVKVTHAIAEAPPEGHTLITVARQENIRMTRAHVALDFLKDRGLVETRRRRSFPATKDVHLDGMTEFHALAHKGEAAPCQ